jgi:hypothetical protein
VDASSNVESEDHERGLELDVPTILRRRDTRTGGRLAAGATLTLRAAGPGTAAVGKTGLAMNVTATEAAAPGYVTVWPESTRPTASSLNATAAGQTIANHVITSTGADGGARFYTQSGTHLVVDISDWYL